jgi:hypothetical protein
MEFQVEIKINFFNFFFISTEKNLQSNTYVDSYISYRKDRESTRQQSP